jgi:transcriptional regulator with PAS, ATPase and Fis domain
MKTLINKKYIKNPQKSRQNIKQQLSVLNGILESINSSVFSVDEDYKYTSINKAHATVTKLVLPASP